MNVILESQCGQTFGELVSRLKASAYRPISKKVLAMCRACSWVVA